MLFENITLWKCRQIHVNRWKQCNSMKRNCYVHEDSLLLCFSPFRFREKVGVKVVKALKREDDGVTHAAIDMLAALMQVGNIIVKTVYTCPPQLRTSDQKLRSLEMKLWIEASKLQVETSQNFSNLPWDLLFRISYVFKFGIITWFTKQITKFVKRKFQGKSEKFYEVPDWSFEVWILNFILNLEVSNQSSELGGHAWTVLTVN